MKSVKDKILAIVIEIVINKFTYLSLTCVSNKSTNRMKNRCFIEREKENSTFLNELFSE